MEHTLRRRAVAVLALAVLAVSGCSGASGRVAPATATSSATTTRGPAAAAPGGPGATASAPARATLALLAALPVKGRAPKTGYRRDRFGPAWRDVDHNGCDTRNDILNRDLVAKSWRPGTHDCVVVAGILVDPYTARTLHFAKVTASAVQIDHVVALADAWQTGAFGWTDDRRTQFANDPLNLLAVDGPTNERKGDGDAATWLPPNPSFRCAYVTRQVAVKSRYGLWVTPAEHDAVLHVLARCP